MKAALYIAIICTCAIYNVFMQSMAFAAINLSLEYNIPISVLMRVDNNVDEALFNLSLRELGEVRTS